jgi:hypothetical protein
MHGQKNPRLWAGARIESVVIVSGRLLAALPGSVLTALPRLLTAALSRFLVLLAGLLLSATTLLSTTLLPATRLTLVLLLGPFVWIAHDYSLLDAPCSPTESFRLLCGSAPSDFKTRAHVDPCRRHCSRR